jgi:hypothetical protein
MFVVVDYFRAEVSKIYDAMWEQGQGRGQQDVDQRKRVEIAVEMEQGFMSLHGMACHHSLLSMNAH